MIRDLISDAQRNSDVRDDVSPEELVTYCLHALTAASALPSKVGGRRLVEVTLDGLSVLKKPTKTPRDNGEQCSTVATVDHI
jgi:hypothetical protein